MAVDPVSGLRIREKDLANLRAALFPGDHKEAVAFALLNNLQLVDISNNLGDSKSLACHPYTTTHSSISPQDRASLGISPGHIRLSVGLEDCDDLIDDLNQALAKLPG